MTNAVALVLAICLLINDVHFLQGSVLKNKYFPSNLVFLISLCLLIEKTSFVPKGLKRKFPLMCILLEVPLSIIILEGSHHYTWSYIQDYTLLNADDLLVQLAKEESLEWLICNMCCGRTDCSDIFANILMKITSFCILISACFFVYK